MHSWLYTINPTLQIVQKRAHGVPMLNASILLLIINLHLADLVRCLVANANPRYEYVIG
jgi:hypothetical protein